MRSPLGVIIFTAVMLLLDTYIFQAVRTVAQNSNPKTKTIVYSIYWGISILAVIGFLLFIYTEQQFLGKKFRTYLFATIIGLFLAKLVGIIFLMVDDLRRVIQWAAGKLLFSRT